MTSTKPIPTRERIHTVLWELAAKHSDRDPAELTPKTRLVHDLGSDSLTVTEMALELEDQLGLPLPDEVLDNPNVTLGDIEQALSAKCS